ncbi:MAG: hypothetical protein KF895_03310 [Parvibaculum sp.]|nr:hypothetical protein [Parvibaculum sp.]
MTKRVILPAEATCPDRSDELPEGFGTGPFGYLIMPPGVNEEDWVLEFDPISEKERAEGYKCVALYAASGKVTEAEFAALAEALERADNEFGYSMSLVRLVDGEATYRLKYNDGSEPLEFSCTEDVYAHVAKERASIRARAALSALGLEVG